MSATNVHHGDSCEASFSFVWKIDVSTLKDYENLTSKTFVMFSISNWYLVAHVKNSRVSVLLCNDMLLSGVFSISLQPSDPEYYNNYYNSCYPNNPQILQLEVTKESLKAEFANILNNQSQKKIYLKFIVTYNSYFQEASIGVTTKLAKDLSTLWGDPETCDVTIRVRTEEFKAHKCILFARSPVFKAMFTNDCKEKNTNTVEVKNVEPHVFQEMLTYIYSGPLPDASKTNAYKLLIAAHQYELSELVDICEMNLMRQITIGSVFSFICLAQLYNLTRLKSSCLEFMSERMEEVLKSTHFHCLHSAQHPDLCKEVFNYYLKKSKSNRS